LGEEAEVRRERRKPEQLHYVTYAITPAHCLRKPLVELDGPI
jgi:hypothetical protein